MPTECTQAKSSLAMMSPVVRVSARDQFMALRVYFDGSRSEAVSMTLAAIAAKEEVWGQFEDDWRFVLQDRGNPRYMHMKEAMPREGEFTNWSEKARDHLLDGLRSLLTSYTKDHQFNVFTCSLDVAAHKRFWRMNPGPSEHICVRQVFQMALAWYRDFPDIILEPIELIFDRNEGFRGKLVCEWNNKKNRAREPFWGMVRAINEADMRHVPALQAVDMVAWAVNRLESKGAESPLALKPDAVVRDMFGAIARLIVTNLDASHRHASVGEMDLARKALI